MPYPFQLPVPAGLALSTHIRCESHPSLISAASSRRNVLRTTLKEFKKSGSTAGSAHLTTIISALEDYIPYILALDNGLSGRNVSGEEIHLTLRQEIVVEWRPCLTASLPGRAPRRVKGKGLDFELCFVLATLAAAWTLMAREKLLLLSGLSNVDPEQRASAIKLAHQHLCRASAIHTFASSRGLESGAAVSVADIEMDTQAALAALTLAESNLITILKDDPYPAIVLQNRDRADNEWMYKAPTIPKVRARIYAHGAVAADELVGKALALLSGAVDDDLRDYAKQLQRTSRAKACRFFGMDAELGGRVGEGIGWLQAAMKEVGLSVDDDSKSLTKGLARFKQSWKDRRDERKWKKGEVGDMDAGQAEESRVIALLYDKWTRTNDIINAQLITPPATLVASMPSGRALSNVDPYRPPVLDAEALAGMRGPLNALEVAQAEDESDENSDDRGEEIHAPGAYPESLPTSQANSRYY